VAYLRDLLMSCGILPAIDRNLLSFQRWLTLYLGAVDDPEHRKVLDQFVSWHLLRKLREQAARCSSAPA
jgi:hypothetical protein